jgi:hypothetical protein
MFFKKGNRDLEKELEDLRQQRFKQEEIGRLKAAIKDERDRIKIAKRVGRYPFSIPLPFRAVVKGGGRLGSELVKLASRVEFKGFNTGIPEVKRKRGRKGDQDRVVDVFDDRF